ncbi:sialate O-acetylesterase-like [Xenia sp. Carnegie-2017]|uniref:sialate O-acetylesterase-like n=1 Tax=Xenia sp. Carnegie-2017 TaxID=2897299 RepID=UPI001F03556F|nr:sialate O-acetylesterase-like [Xenia sp. Carnegie-2017]
MAMLRSCFCAILFVFTAVSITYGHNTFRFSTIYGDHMVLQQAPKRAIVWGYGEIGRRVVVRLSNKWHHAYVYARQEGREEVGVWQVVLQPISAGGPYRISAYSYVQGSFKKITLDDVLFGDVWICSGQSNMQYTLDISENGSQAINESINYPNIRIFSVGLDCSMIPLNEVSRVELPWSIPSTETLNGTTWVYFSALCWYYGVQLYKTLNYPIGLIGSSFGGSPIESWSSPDALAQCGWTGNVLISPPILLLGPQGYPDIGSFTLYSCMWNAMIVPFLNMTIYGSIFYQGETNALARDFNVLPYNCTFPAMINDWRAKWYASTQNNTDPQFPFGFVQLSAVGNDTTTNENNFAPLRWDQTAGKGYAPNAQLKKTFMAVAMDLGNPLSPHDSIHPTDKENIGYRLGLSGLSLAYGRERYYTGPLVYEIKKIAIEHDSLLVINYKSVNISIEIRSNTGFEILCNDSWSASPIVYNTITSVFLLARCDPDKVRYAWSDYPCESLKCAVYSGGLPSPPFIMDGPFS